MSRQYTMTKVMNAEYDAVNSYLVGLFGDDPGQEIPPANAYLNGADPTVGTHSFGVANTSQSDCNSIIAFCATRPGCEAASAGPTTGSYDFWTLALALWNLKPVQPVGP